MEKKPYSAPFTERFLVASEKIMITASPGVSDEEWGTNQGIDAKSGLLFRDEKGKDGSRPHSFWDD